jgi:rubrerythrin
MTPELTAYEVLEIAEKMERDAAKFYRKAAGMCDDPRICKLLTELAQWEKRHVRIFAEMKEHLSEHAWELGYFEPDRIDISRVRVPPTISDSHADPARELTGAETKADILRVAIKKENDAIAYYTSLKEFVLGEGNLEVIEDIIREEQRHVRILTQSLEQIS